jgi:hypothetical protein
LVAGVRSYVQRAREADALLELKPKTPAEHIRGKLDFEMGTSDPAKADFFLPLSLAWDATAYRHYPFNSTAGDLADHLLKSYSGVRLRTGEHRERTVVLDEPQVRFLDALAEAAGVPHQRGQEEVEIPFDDMRERHTITMRGAQRESEEYQTGQAEGGISDAELSRRHKAVLEQAEQEWQEYVRRKEAKSKTL